MQPDTRPPRPRWGRRLLVTAIILVVVVFVWHLILNASLKRDIFEQEELTEYETGSEISVNPLTNLVRITIELPPVDEDNPFASLGASFGEAIVQMIGPGAIERELNTRAREQYDIYAIAVPYRVRIETTPASEETIARYQAEQETALEKARAEREAAKQAAAAEAERKAREHREFVISYVAENLELVDVKVAPGERLGQRIMGIFGTVVNNGPDTLDEVEIRVYFLDDQGRRIGEHEFHPVLVTEWAIGDNTPLRPGYREDFGYNLEDHAPSGWAEKVEVEIVEIELAD